MFQMIDELITAGAVLDALRRQQRAARIKLEEESAKSAKDEEAVATLTADITKLEKLEENMRAAQAMDQDKVVEWVIEELGLQRKELLELGTKEVMRKRLHCDLL